MARRPGTRRLAPAAAEGLGTPIHMLLVDGSQAYCEGLVHFVRQQGHARLVGCVDSAERIEPDMILKADVVLVEMELADRSGLAVCHQIAERSYPPRVILLIPGDRDSYLAAAYACGAAGIVLRSTPAAEVLERMRQSLAGDVFTPAQLKRIQRWEEEVGCRLRRLRQREWQLLWLVASGPTNDEIATVLGVSRNTVEKHISALLTKLELASRTALFAFLLKHNLEFLQRLVEENDPFLPWLNYHAVGSPGSEPQ